MNRATKEAILPSGLEFSKVEFPSHPGVLGQLAFKSWNPSERRQRAIKRTGKIVGLIFACSLIGLFVHILLLVIIPGLLLTVIMIAPLFLKLLSEEKSFYYVEATCPHCMKPKRLRPYLNTELRDEVTVQCPDCGQTSRARLIAL